MGTAKTFMLLAMLTALFMAVGYVVGGAVGMGIAFAIACGMNAFSYWNADKIVLKMQGAQEISPETASPMLKAFAKDVERLADRAGLPTPRIYVIETPQPNAFATGRNPQNAAVAATTGLLGMLTREEVAGVMAHELAHVQKRDTLTMTVTATIAGAIGMLANFAMFFGRERAGIIGSLAVMIVAPMAAGLVQMAISRSREFEADKRGAEICGNPLWLASALQKIERGSRASINVQAERNPAMAHMYISNPLSGRASFRQLFSTHPLTANRVEALRRQAADMGVSGDGANTSAARAPTGPWG